VKACAHANIVEDERHPDGSVDGVCLDCGERGFAIRDVPYEQFQRAEIHHLAGLKRQRRMHRRKRS
jgi:hypothetical protein